MSDKISISTNKVVCKALQTGPRATIFGDITNKVSPHKTTTTSFQKHLFEHNVTAIIPNFYLSSSAPLVEEDNFAIDILSEDIEGSGCEDDLFDEHDLYGMDIETAHFGGKLAKKKVAKAPSRPANKQKGLSRKAKKQHVAANHMANKKAKQEQRKKAAAVKEAKLEQSNLIEALQTVEGLPIVAAAEVIRAPSAKMADSEAVVDFNDCVHHVPAIPSLPAIHISNNRFDPLLLVEEKEEEENVSTNPVGIPNTGLLGRGLRFAKRLVAKAANFIKSAFTAARNIVSC